MFFSRRKAIGLIEILIVSVVILLAFLPIMMNMIGVQKVLYKTKAAVIAFPLLMEGYEWVMGLPFDKVTESLNDGLMKIEDYKVDAYYTLTYPKSFSKAVKKIERYIKVSDVIPGLLKKVLIVVKWVDKNSGKEMKMNITVFKYKENYVQ